VLTGNEWLFLNFDPSMFKSRGAVNDALSILNETLAIAGFDRKRIVCEVTEHRTEEENLLSLVGAMRDRGYKIAVDDYGADDSDMARVRKLSPDIIKFDAYWITRMMDSGTAGAALLKDMVLTFKDRGILTLFEGIEDGWQLDLAVECQVDFVQGYVLARPQTVPTNFSDFRSNAPATTTPLPQVAAERPHMRTSLDLWDKEFSALMDQPAPMAVNAPAFSDTPRPAEAPAAAFAPRRPVVAFGKRTR
jgi:EAL domain-containing protein (putative c-di-GMP-specific phosphodiesterase class I)